MSRYSPIKTFGGVGSYSNKEVLSYSVNLTVFTEGIRQRFYILGLLTDYEKIPYIFSSILEVIRDRSKSGSLAQLSSKLAGQEALVIISANDRSYLFLSGSTLPQFYFTFKNGSVAMSNFGSIPESGWAILSSDKLSENTLKWMPLVKDVTPRLLAMQVINKESGGLALSIAAINAEIINPQFLKKNALISCNSDLGKTRKNNEDACFASSLDFSYSENVERHQILCVADGAGGHGYGEVASRETALGFFGGITSSLIKGERNISSELRSIIYSINERILNIKRRMISDMASTLSAAVIRGGDVFVGHVGDGRVYSLDVMSGQIIQLTRDHKYVQDLVETGVITKEEAKFHPQRNIITSAIGMKEPRIDTLVLNDLFSEYRKIIVCSDGLSDLVEDPEISEISIHNRPPQRIINDLIMLANAKGGLDNISVAMLEYLL